MKKDFNVFGMTCAACQGHVLKAVKKINGVYSVNVNLLSNSMSVIYDDNICNDDIIINAVIDAGYNASLKYENKVVSKNVKDHSLRKLIIAFIFLILTMYVSMGNMMFNFPLPYIFNHSRNPLGFALIQFLLILPIIYIYRSYFINGYKRLFKRSPNMDTLIAIGATASIIYGIISVFIMSYSYSKIVDGINISYYTDLIETYHKNLYFEAAGMILTLVSLGKYLEELSKKKTTASLESLTDLAPKKALVIRNGIEQIVEASNVLKDEIVIVKKGDSIPVDGVIIEGACSIDESNITGESIPVYKNINDKVYSSTIVKTGYVKVKAVSVGDDTSIANIIKLVEEASNSKAPISKLADKVSGIFVPVIFSISIICFIVNMLISHNFELSFNFAVSVVVIACPCALGLATPVAIMVASGKGAQLGLLIKDAQILENTHHIKYIVLDKTGTITKGSPIVIDYINLSNDDISDIIYSLEMKSEHPLASAITSYFKDSNIVDILDYKAIDGFGLCGIYNDSIYKIGNIINDESNNELVDSLRDEGKTVLIVSKDDIDIAIISIKDPIKESSKEAIDLLTKRNINIIMVTGDNEKTALSIAKEVGITNVIAGVEPVKKGEIIDSLKGQKHELVAMVGDGVNDSIALTKADIGIAIGGGADVALLNSDIVLLKKELLDVVNVIDLSKRTLNTIKINLFWAFFYNIICVVIASGVFYYINGFKINPMIGSIAMSISSVSVVLNALTINLFKPKKIVSNNDIIINVKGMMCNKCVKHVEDACLSVNGVIFAKASLENKNVVINKEDNVAIEDIKNAIRNSGYKVR